MTPNHEVAEVVWVPLDFLMQPDKREPMQWEWQGKTLETDSYLICELPHLGPVAHDD